MYAITLAGAAIIWPFIVSYFGGRFGPDVAGRFLERPGKIPSSGKDLTAETLDKWLRAPATAQYRRPYALLIIPLDVVFIVLAGGFLFAGSVWLAGASTWPEPLSRLQFWLAGALPIAYALADLIEDVLIVAVLLSHKVTATSFSRMRTATRFKLVFFSLAALQVIAIGIYALYFSEASR
jgi:hypothetical protein